MSTPLPVEPDETSAGERWRESNCAWLDARLSLLRLRLLRHAAEADDAGALDAQTEAARQALVDTTARLRESGRPPALTMLADATGLTPLEEELLVLCAAPELDQTSAQVCALLSGDDRLRHPTVALAVDLFGDDPGPMVVRDALSAAGALRRNRLIVLDGDHADTTRLADRELEVDERVIDYLRGLDVPDARLDALWTPCDSDVGRPTRAVSLEARSLADAMAGAEGWPRVNIVADSIGSGRDLTVATSAELNLRPFLLDLRAFSALSVADRAVAERLMEREAILGRAAIVVELSGADAPESVTFASLCRRLAAVVFGISEEPVAASSDVIRHRVARPGPDAQHEAWRSALSSHPNAVNGELDLVTAQFDLDPAAIRRAVETARSRAARRDGPDRGTILAADIWDACRENLSLSLADLGVRLTGRYGWEDIVLTRESSVQLHELADQVRHRREVYDRWGFVAPGGRGRGISALFAGPTGTGKTMAAEIVARDLSLDLFRIDLSGIVSKYIGETEKNLRRVFDAAERSGAVLFFDEADALFGKRTDIRDSHDRYANIEVNYLLQRMEEYAGLAILATNRRASLDTAFLRRLRFIVEFPFPTPEQRREIWSRVFPPTAAVSVLDLGFLARLELSGGNIRGIALNAAFIAAAARAPIGMTHVLKAVGREYTKLERPLTPTEFGSYYEEVRA